MADEREQREEQALNDTYKKGANQVGKQAGKAGKKLAGKGAKAAGKAAATAGKKAAALASKAAGKLVAVIGSALGAALPYILIILGVFFIFYFIYDIFFESKGKTETYQSEDEKEYNNVKKDPKTGAIVNSELTTGNKIVKAFYTFFSERSLWVTVQDENGEYIQKEPLQYNSKEFVEAFGIDGEGDGNGGTKGLLKDKYGREKSFFLNFNALYALDEYLHDGQFKFPEQFTQPVKYDPETFELVQLTEKDKENKDGKNILTAESVKYNGAAGELLKPTEEKTTGVWDYGFGSIANYKKYAEIYVNKGEYTQVQLWNQTSGTMETFDYETAKKLLEQTAALGATANDPNYTGAVYVGKLPDKEYTGKERKDLVYMIDRVTSPAGNISNEIECIMEATPEPFTDATSNKVTVNTISEREEFLTNIDTSNPSAGKQQVYIDNLTGSRTFSSTDANGNANKPVKVKVKYFEKTEVSLTNTATGFVHAQIPRYVGDPDLSGITGSEYFIDYMTNYQTYVPETVMTEFDFEKRTELDDEELLAILDKEIYAEGGGSSNPPNFEVGGGADSSVVEKTMQYWESFDKHGNTYGVDPYLLIAMASQESGGNHDKYLTDNRCATAGCGLMQIEKPGITVKQTVAFNHHTQEMETMKITSKADVTDVDDNIKAGAMQLASRAKGFQYNVTASLQAYNYGPAGMDRVLLKHLETLGTASLSDMKGNGGVTASGRTAINEYLATNDTAWLEQRAWYSNSGSSPSGCSFFPACPGDPEYIEHVMRYYAAAPGQPNGDVPWFMNEEGVLFNLNGETSQGVVSGSGGGTIPSISSSSQDGWLKKGWKKLKDMWDNIFPETEIELPEERLLYENKKTKGEADEIVKMMFVMEEKKFFSEYQDFSLEDWKEKFKLLFSNPMGGAWGNSGPTVDYKLWFPNGYTQPLEEENVIKNPYVVGSHNGVDVIAIEGTNVVAVADGVISKISEAQTGGGRYVLIDHGENVYTKYTGLKTIDVKAGVAIRRGDKIGTSGDNPEGDVLHFELLKGNINEDPTWIINGRGFADIDTEVTGIYKDILLETVNKAIEIASNPNMKYSMDNRYGKGIYDCSSFTERMYWYGQAVALGIDHLGEYSSTGSVGTSGYSDRKKTVDIGTYTVPQEQLLANYRVPLNPSNMSNLQSGDLLFKGSGSGGNAHTVMIIEVISPTEVKIAHAFGRSSTPNLKCEVVSSKTISAYHSAYRAIFFIKDEWERRGLAPKDPETPTSPEEEKPE